MNHLWMMEMIHRQSSSDEVLHGITHLVSYDITTGSDKLENCLCLSILKIVSS